MVLLVLPLLLVLNTTPASGSEPRRGRASMAEEASRLLNTPERRVRSTDRRVVNLIEAGVRRSYSFAELVTLLHETDVIIYVEAVHALPPFVNGHTFLVPSYDAQRYLRIQLRQGLHPDETIALLAHELRHALEVATEPTVTTQATFAAFYGRIGRRVPGAHNRFDTAAAQATGRLVRSELGGGEN